MSALHQLTRQASIVVADPNEANFRVAAIGAGRVSASQIISDESMHIAAAMRSLLLALPNLDAVRRSNVLLALESLCRDAPLECQRSQSPWWSDLDA